MKYGIIELKNNTNPQPILMIRDRNSDGSSLELFFIKSIIKDKDMELIELERVDIALARIAAIKRPITGDGIFSMIYFEKTLS
jgi:hypothetical protein